MEYTKGIICACEYNGYNYNEYNYCYDIRTGIKIVSCQRKNQCFQTKASNIKSTFFDKDSQRTFMKKCFWLKEVSSNMK